ncbi:competence/damage-inducible protein A [Ktedonosporobacter rubrisoli]|uniref:CinA-like protein n=1 Tax=Ktedonosporobacter rubrisoli TaxID=2509675 RepID=A0A4P6K2N7_KTERU|nr:competence/damage-inducible protein A [Ktedonosporobacter rubrisoli]QBD82488.1 competence/damage-inducible protein A [Ktedonosporobacter rubrisoli]
MKAEILSCGTELLLGHITDTNATYLSQNLTTLGIDLYFVSQVGDNLGRIVETLQRAWQRADLIIMTGGLGPTEDDLAREAISTLLGETMQVDPQLEAELRKRFSHLGAQMPERNLKQASLIPSARALPNPVGSAPGWWVEKEDHIIIAMPGVPSEMYRMWEQEAVPRLSPYTDGMMFTRILRVAGLGESSVEEQLGALIHSNNPTLATYAKLDAVDVRITAKAETREKAELQVLEMEAQVRQILGQHIFGIDKDTLASVIGTLLQERRQTLGIMESLTGGLLSGMITDIPGSSRYFVGGLVTYSSELKAQMGVPQETLQQFGAVSEETARAMAHAVRQRLGTTYGLGITGVAGPDKQEDRPVGTVYIAIEGPQGTFASQRAGWTSSRSDNRRRASLAALDILRRFLAGSLTPES